MSENNKPKITCELLFITPEMAKKMLEGNLGNRNKRWWWIDAMAAAMRRGEWITTHQGIAFTASGRLLDGQHRLESIIASGQGLWMLVTKDIDDGAFKVIDNGIKRSIADTTNLPKRLAEVCSIIGKLVFGAPPTSQQVIDIASSGTQDVHEDLIENCGGVKKYYASAPMRMAVTALVLDGYSKTDVFKTYADMVHEKFGDLPMSAQSLIRQVNAGKAVAGNTHDTLARGLKVLNPNNKNLSKIQCSDAEIDSARAYAKSVFKKSMSCSNGS